MLENWQFNFPPEIITEFCLVLKNWYPAFLWWFQICFKCVYNRLTYPDHTGSQVKMFTQVIEFYWLWHKGLIKYWGQLSLYHCHFIKNYLVDYKNLIESNFIMLLRETFNWHLLNIWSAQKNISWRQRKNVPIVKTTVYMLENRKHYS